MDKDSALGCFGVILIVAACIMHPSLILLLIGLALLCKNK